MAALFILFALLISIYAAVSWWQTGKDGQSDDCRQIKGLCCKYPHVHRLLALVTYVHHWIYNSIHKFEKYA
jgi:hypothetical protein